MLVQVFRITLVRRLSDRMLKVIGLISFTDRFAYHDHTDFPESLSTLWSDHPKSYNGLYVIRVLIP